MLEATTTKVMREGPRDENHVIESLFYPIGETDTFGPAMYPGVESPKWRPNSAT